MYVTTRNIIAVVLLTFAGSAGATDEIGHLTWDCDRAGAPSLQEVKLLFNTPSNYRASLLRERLVSRLRAECKTGTSRLQVVLNPLPAATEPRLVAALDLRARAGRESATH